ncbi:ABC transporter substrate-binding protein [Planctomycetes bacterium Pla133]
MAVHFVTRRACVALAALTLVACGPPDSTDVAEAAVDGFPLAIPGPGGGEVLLERPAWRILPGNAGALDLLSSLIEPERVVAITVGTRPYSVALRGDFDGSGVREVESFDLETIVSLEPDVVVSHAWQSIDKGPFLRRVGIPVFEIPDAVDFEGLCDVIALLGAAVGEDQRASATIADLRARLATLAEVDRSRFDAMTYSSSGAGGWTAAEGTTAEAFMTWAGLTPAATAAGLRGHHQVDHERLLDIDPRVLIIASDDGDPDASTTLLALRADERLSSLRALGDDGLVIVLPDELFSCTSHYLVEAAERVAAAVDARWRP